MLSSVFSVHRNGVTEVSAMYRTVSDSRLQVHSATDTIRHHYLGLALRLALLAVGCLSLTTRTSGVTPSTLPSTPLSVGDRSDLFNVERSTVVSLARCEPRDALWRIIKPAIQGQRRRLPRCPAWLPLYAIAHDDDGGDGEGDSGDDSGDNDVMKALSQLRPSMTELCEAFRGVVDATGTACAGAWGMVVWAISRVWCAVQRVMSIAVWAIQSVARVCEGVGATAWSIVSSVVRAFVVVVTAPAAVAWRAARRAMSPLAHGVLSFTRPVHPIALALWRLVQAFVGVGRACGSLGLSVVGVICVSARQYVGVVVAMVVVLVLVIRRIFWTSRSAVVRRHQLRMQRAASTVGGVVGMADSNQRPTCVFCLDELAGMPVRILACSHRFHEQCLRVWLLRKNICPLCRRPVTAVSLMGALF